MDYFHFSRADAFSVSVPMSLAAAFLSLVVDARFQVSANVHTRIWTNEQVLAARLYRDGQIGLQEALSRYLNAAANLPALGTNTKVLSKKRAKEEAWVVDHVVARVANQYRATLRDPSAIRAWLPLVENLTNTSVAVRNDRSI